MKKRLDIEEVRLVGNWILDDGKVIEDSTCERIAYLANHYLKEIALDEDEWSILYENPDDQNYWELTYPQSQLHGGGPPSLTKISRHEAMKKYQIQC